MHQNRDDHIQTQEYSNITSYRANIPAGFTVRLTVCLTVCFIICFIIGFTVRLNVSSKYDAVFDWYQAEQDSDRKQYLIDSIEIDICIQIHSAHRADKAVVDLSQIARPQQIHDRATRIVICLLCERIVFGRCLFECRFASCAESEKIAVIDDSRMNEPPAAHHKYEKHHKSQFLPHLLIRLISEKMKDEREKCDKYRRICVVI